MLYRKRKIERDRFLREAMLIVDPREIVDGNLRVVGFRVIGATLARRREVWALLQPGEVRFGANDTILAAKVLEPCPKNEELYELAKKMAVDVWHISRG